MNSKLRTSMIIAAAVAIIGLILAFVGLAFGGMKAVSIGSDGIKLEGQDKGVIEIDKSFDPKTVKSIDGNFDLRDVIFKAAPAGTEINVSSKGVSKDFFIENKDGVLTMADSHQGSTFSDFHFYLFNFYGSGPWKDITITYPAGSEFEDISIHSDSGSINISDLKANDMKISSDLGDTKLDNVSTITLDHDSNSGNFNLINTNIKSLKFNMDLGDATATGYNGEEIAGSSNSGNVNFEGSIKGPVDISSDLGDVTFKIKGSEEQFSYDLSTDLGDVTLNGQGAGNNLTKTYEGKPLFKVENDAGNIKVEFK